MTSEPGDFHHELDDLEASSVEKVRDRPARNVQFGEFLRTLFILGWRSPCFIASAVIVSIFCVLLISIDLSTAVEWPDTPDPDRFTLPYGYEALFQTFFGLKDAFNMSFGPGPKEGEPTSIAKEVRQVFEDIRTNITQGSGIVTRPIEMFDDRDEMIKQFQKAYDGTNIAFYYDAFSALQETNISVFTVAMGSDLRNALLSVVEAVTSYYPDQNNPLPTVTLAMREFASPAHTGSFGTDALTGYIPILWVTILASLIATKIFELCKHKILFYLRINGLRAWILGLVVVVYGLTAIVPVTVVATFFFAFVASSTKHSNFFILFISSFMYGVGQWLFSCFLMPIFFPKAGIAIYFVVLILVPSVFMIIGGIRTTAEINDVVFIVFSILFPQSSYMNTFWVLSQVKWSQGPMSMEHMNLKFNSLSMSMLFGFQVLNILMYGGLMVIAYLYCPRRFGRAPLRCGRCSGGKKDGSVANSGSAALIMDALRKEYKVKGKKFCALDSLSYTVNNDETIIIIGPNGAGKSTMINIITGMIAPDEGTITAYGEVVTSNFAPFYDNLGVVFQENVLVADLTVKEHFRLIGRLRMLTDSAIKIRREHLMSSLSFSDCLAKRAGSLSGGQKRKLCIALALMSHPSFLIMDEPTAGVDVEARQLIWKTVSESNTTSMIATHSIEEGESVCTRMMIMSKGTIAFQGSPAELRQQTKSGYILSVNSENVDYEGVLGCIRAIVPEAEVDPEMNTRILVPNDLRMADVLDALESKKKKLRLEDYTVHLTNLEEQLVKLVEQDEFQS